MIEESRSVLNETVDSYYKINTDFLFLTDKLGIVEDKIRKTPWYRIGTHWKLYKELKDLDKETDQIGKRLKKLKENPISVVRRT